MSQAAPDKRAHHRLRVLDLAQAPGHVSEACRQRGMSRPQFYEVKRRVQSHGLEGLKHLPPVHPSHPLTTPPEVEARLPELSLTHPGWGCNKLRDDLGAFRAMDCGCSPQD